MKSFKLGFLLVMVALAVLLGVQSTSHALMKLWLSDLSSAPVIITDEGAGDITSGEGAITFSGPIGDWIVNVTTGLSYPVLGGPGVPYVDLNSVNVTNRTGGDLLIAVGQTGFTAFDSGTAGPFTLAVGGTTSGEVEFDVWLNKSNLYPWDDDNNYTFANLFFDSSPFSGTATGLVNEVYDPYSLTISAFITHLGAGSTSFDAELKVPEPISLILLGFGLIGLAGYGRKKLFKK